MTVTGIVITAPVWFPMIARVVVTVAGTSFGVNENSIPRATTALADWASPIKDGVVADEFDAKPVPTNTAADES